jgi:hypothetical protein
VQRSSNPDHLKEQVMSLYTRNHPDPGDLVTAAHADPTPVRIGIPVSRWRRSPVPRRVAAAMRAIACHCVGAVVALTLLVAIIPALGAKAAPPTASFPPGIWRGTAVVVGGFSGDGVDVSVTAPIRFSFQVNVAPDGSVVDGTWTVTGEVTTVVPDGQGAASFTGTGTLQGTGARLEFIGPVQLTGSATVQGATYPFDVAVDIEGGFAPTSATCSMVSGDFVTEARDIQESMGFASTMTGPFTTYRIGEAGANLAPTFEDQYVTLVTNAEALAALAQPPAADVVALAQQAEAFYQNVYSFADCPGGTPNLGPGELPYNYFTQTVGRLLLKALANPAAYTADELRSLADAAVRVGVVSVTAADQTLAGQVEEALFNALGTKLEQAEAAQNQEDCASIAAAAEKLDFDELLDSATACATGA